MVHVVVKVVVNVMVHVVPDVVVNVMVHVVVDVVVRVVVNVIPLPSPWPIGHSIGNETTRLFSGPVMAPPDLTSAVERSLFLLGPRGCARRRARRRLVCRRRRALCNLATRLVVYHAGARRDSRVLRLA